MSKVAIITGSDGGVGRALVKTYLSDDYLVIGLDRVYSQSNAETGLRNIQTDLLLFSKNSNYRRDILSELRSVLPEMTAKLVLINNAAEQVIKPLADIEWIDWEASLAVNTVAPFFLVQGLVDELKASSGHVVNVSSIHGKLTKSNFTCYAASKAALSKLTESLALELSQLGISINAVAPAAISTEMLNAGFDKNPEKLQVLKDYHPSKSIGSPEQLAKFIKSISEQEGGFLTGSVVDFSGGISGRLHDPD